MAFPISPTNGQIYKNYKYNSTTGSWTIPNGSKLVNSSVLTKTTQSSANSTTSYFDISGLSVLYTPKKIGNVIVVRGIFSAGIALNTAGLNHAGVTIRTLINTTPGTDNTFWYRDDDTNAPKEVQTTLNSILYYTTTNTNAITIKGQISTVLSGGAATMGINIWGGTSYIEIQEFEG